MVNLIKRWLPAVLLMAAIFFFSSIPSIAMPYFGSWDMLVKKSGHMLGYALLGLAYLRGINSFRWRSAVIVLLGVVLYALSDEYHQSFVAGRTSSLTDVTIDTIGALLGLAIATVSPALRRTIFLS
jgi:VanZ family protein